MRFKNNAQRKAVMAKLTKRERDIFKRNPMPDFDLSFDRRTKLYQKPIILKKRPEYSRITSKYFKSKKSTRAGRKAAMETSTEEWGI